jgi:hypothetical protein
VPEGANRQNRQSRQSFFWSEPNKLWFGVFGAFGGSTGAAEQRQ